MSKTRPKVIAATLLVCAAIVIAYVLYILLSPNRFTFGSFALFCLFPFLAAYFTGLVFWKRAD